MTTKVAEAIIKLVPGGAPALSHLSDAEILANTRRLVATSNKLFANLLLHLAEVETRGIHRTRACASLYTYCIYELRMSEDAAARRSSAARLVKAYPALFDAIARGELHLTGLLMLGPHLTPENHVEVLGRAKFRTKKEIAKLVRELHPLPGVPDQMEPLGPELPRPLRAPTREQWLDSLCPPVRELRPGERPADWANDTAESVDQACAGAMQHDDGSAAAANDPTSPPGADVRTAPARRDSSPPASDASAEPPPICASASDEPPPLCAAASDQPPPVCASASDQPPPVCAAASDQPPSIAVPARSELPPITGPQQYRMQFTATEEHVRLVERAKDLLARTSPGCSLGELHERAMQLLVESLEKKLFAVTERPRNARKQRAKAAPVAVPEETKREHNRDVPAAVQREVFTRDAGRCAYVDERGQRCRETRYLELHHLHPFALGGAPIAGNLALRCAAHNALAAEEDFGRDLIEHKRGGARHASFSSHAP